MFLIQNFAGFSVREAARVAFASGRIRMLALRQSDVSCAGELDVLCNFCLSKTRAEQMERGEAPSESPLSTLEASSLSYLICPLSFAIILLVALSLLHPVTPRSFFLPPLCAVDTFLHFFRSLSHPSPWPPEHSSV